MGLGNVIATLRVFGLRLMGAVTEDVGDKPPDIVNRFE